MNSGWVTNIKKVGRREIVPIGHIGKFNSDFGGNKNLGKNRINHAMLKFIAATEIRNQLKSEDSRHNWEKVDQKGCLSKIASRNFTEIIKSSSAVLFSTENIANFYESAIAGQERTLIGQVDE